jgi:hypothetical protein
MTMDDDATGSPGGYAGFQLARALAAANHADAAVRDGAAKRLRQWAEVIRGRGDGSIATGSRTPVKNTPAWATLEVVTGGFATGALLAGGPLQAHERALLAEVAPGVPEPDARLALNSFFLTDQGLERLQALLASGRFGIEVPEEGALLVVAWLLRAGEIGEAWALVEQLAPWFSTLRFYPAELAEARTHGELLWVDDVATATRCLRAVKANPQILAQKEAVEVWAPMHDRMAALMAETVAGEAPLALRTADGAWQCSEAGRFTVTGGWPCATYPQGWRARASALLDRCQQMRAEHRLCARPEREGDSFATLREGLQRCVDAPESLTGKQVGRIRLVLARYIATHGLPESAGRAAWRQRQLAQTAGATFEQIARQVAMRLEAFRSDEGLDDIAPVVAPIDADEAATSGMRAGTAVPPSLRRKVGRAQKGTAAELVERGTIPSSEVLAKVLPQWTAGLRAADVADPALRALHAALYRAFRRRRSLLLVDLQRQVQFDELPWVSVIGRFRSQDDQAARRVAMQALADASQLALVAFPQTLLPNRLLQELATLGDAAGLKLPLVDEVAADIFMGRFSPRFVVAAKVAAGMLQGSLYARYYGIDCAALAALPVPAEKAAGDGQHDALSRLCASRAGVRLAAWSVARNGMVIEQAQILTTHNLAVLFAELGLGERLAAQLPGMARRCFEWICVQLQVVVDHRHARLIQIKNSACAWRQMVFFLSLCEAQDIGAFMAWSKAHLEAQGDEFRRLFLPALSGLASAAGGQESKIEPFVGWRQERHWLMPDSLARG